MLTIKICSLKYLYILIKQVKKQDQKKKKTAFEKLTFYTQSTTNAEHKAGGF